MSQINFTPKTIQLPWKLSHVPDGRLVNIFSLTQLPQFPRAIRSKFRSVIDRLLELPYN
ncbi:hypothetical protein PL9631_590030 [Planktothrix paucivesiculata PCC 9631]|uniref:Uncharacterized protein n=1 Tax=Planktothrix paucivesiculata PCC 9631 TaxID=671071 RepID=A0A7Z9BRZ7_9CYAN|nr:hypothetical protein PL9631_590030 [Planktothrix paucivesiculata PCC 9631]